MFNKFNAFYNVTNKITATFYNKHVNIFQNQYVLQLMFII